MFQELVKTIKTASQGMSIADFTPSPPLPLLQARAGVGSTVDVLRLLAAFSNETSYTVWESLVSTLSTFKKLFSYTDFYESFKSYAVEMFKPSLTRLGWEPRDSDGMEGGREGGKVGDV